MKQTEGNKSVEVVMPGAFGPRSIGVDDADMSPRAYATDWLSVFSLPARPSVVCLDIASGILAGSLLAQVVLFVGLLQSPLYAIALATGLITTLGWVAIWVLQIASPWEKWGVGYRFVCLAIGVAIIVLV